MLNHINKAKVWLLLALLSLTLACEGGYYDFSGPKPSPKKESKKQQRVDYVYPPNSDSPKLEFSYLDTYDREPVHQGTPIAPQEMFPQSTTTEVWAELEVKNLLYKDHNQTYKLTFKYIQENGRLLDSYTTTWTIKKDWDYAWHFDCWGWDSPGHWPLGTHTVEVWINGTKFTSKNFTIVKDTDTHTPQKSCQSSWWRSSP